MTAGRLYQGGRRNSRPHALALAPDGNQRGWSETAWSGAGSGCLVFEPQQFRVQIRTFVLRTMGRQHEGELNRSSDWPGFEALMDVARRTSDQLVEIAEGLVEEVVKAVRRALGEVVPEPDE